jgi:hypothetical protein
MPTLYLVGSSILFFMFVLNKSYYFSSINKAKANKTSQRTETSKARLHRME